MIRSNGRVILRQGFEIKGETLGVPLLEVAILAREVEALASSYAS